MQAISGPYLGSRPSALDAFGRLGCARCMILATAGSWPSRPAVVGARGWLCSSVAGVAVPAGNHLGEPQTSAPAWGDGTGHSPPSMPAGEALGQLGLGDDDDALVGDGEAALAVPLQVVADRRAGGHARLLVDDGPADAAVPADVH